MTICDDGIDLAIYEHNLGNLFLSGACTENAITGTWVTHDFLAQASTVNSSVSSTLLDIEISYFVKYQDNNCDTILNPVNDVLARSARRALS